MAPLSARSTTFGRIFAAGSRLKGASKHSKRLKRKPLAQLAAAQFLFVLSHLDAVVAIPCMYCRWGQLVAVNGSIAAILSISIIIHNFSHLLLESINIDFENIYYIL